MSSFGRRPFDAGARAGRATFLAILGTSRGRIAWLISWLDFVAGEGGKAIERGISIERGWAASWPTSWADHAFAIEQIEPRQDHHHDAGQRPVVRDVAEHEKAERDHPDDLAVD